MADAHEHLHEMAYSNSFGAPMGLSSGAPSSVKRDIQRSPNETRI